MWFAQRAGTSSGRPDWRATVLPAGEAGTATVTVTNAAGIAKDCVADPRLNSLAHLTLLGTNVVSLTLHSGISRMRWLLKMCEKRSQQNKLASEVVLQYHYLCGVKEGLQKLQ